MTETQDIPLHYCHAKIGGTGSSLYYSLLFLPPAERTTLTALYALRRELDEPADECADAGVARARLAWWQEELARVLAGRPRHPVTRLLAEPLARHAVPPELFHRLLAAAAQRLPPMRCERLDDWLAYCEAGGGTLAELGVRLCGTRDATTLAHARRLGAALEHAEWLFELGWHARRDRLPLPRPDLARFGVSETALVHGQDSDAVRALLAFAVERAERDLDGALRALPDHARDWLLPLRVRARLARATLALARRRGYPQLRRPLVLTPLRRLWTAWRTRRGR